MNRIPVVTLCVAATLMSGTAVGAAAPVCQAGSSAICGPKGVPDAVLSSGSGGQVSHGRGFKTASVGMHLEPGDRVLVGETGLRIAIGPSCAAFLAPHTVATIKREGTAICASSTASAKPPFSDADLHTVAADLPARVTPAAPGDPGILGAVTPTQAAIGIGALAGVGVIVGLGLSGGSGDTNSTVSTQ